MLDRSATSDRLNLFNRALAPQPFRKETGDGATIFTKGGTLYKLESILGVGGLAVVYLATRFADKKPVALKVGHKSIKEARALLEREARILSKLDHPSIVRLLDYGETVGGERFLATELVRAQTVDLLLRANGGKLPLVRSAHICLQIADALEHAHQRGVVHRDIKPVNVLINRIENVDHINLFDFGIATDGAEDENVADSGSILYASPEQLDCQSATPQSDIYQLALLLFEMFTGTLPFERTLIEAVRYRQGELPALPDDEALGDCVLLPGMRQLLTSALSPDPDERPCSMNLFAHELRRILCKLRISNLRLETECAIMQA